VSGQRGHAEILVLGHHKYLAGAGKTPAAPPRGLRKPTSLPHKGAHEMRTPGPSCTSPDKDKKHNSDLSTS